MKLYTANRAPNPRRVEIFIAEKGIEGIARVEVDLNTSAHKETDFRRVNPLSRVPVLQLDDGRYLAESRAICSYLEYLHPEPNLMGADATERAFIEMIDRQIEFHLFLAIANAVRHSHPGLAVLENPQFPDFGAAQSLRVREVARWFDEHLAKQSYAAGSRFTIADITAYCALEFARLIKFKPAAEGFAHIAAWQARIAARPSVA